SEWFDRQRGLALGLAMAGVGLGVAIVPQFAAFMIRTYGWREAYIGLGVAILGLAVLPVAGFLREPSDKTRRHRQSQEEIAPGLTLAEAMRRSSQFWLLIAALFLAVVAINGVLAHIVPLLTDRGITVGAATTALSVSGIALIVGRMVAGYCLDRFFGPNVAIF